MLPYFPINGSLTHILGRLSGVARSLRSTCGILLLLFGFGVKALIRYNNTKSPFSMNSELFKQIDGVAKGSPLGPTLANIIMTTFEDEIVRQLIDSNVIKFYARYVDDTLVLAKPSDIPIILRAFNSFHPQIQFTFEDFPDNNVHFLDLKINSSDITIFRKSTHTGQYTHLSSFTPWSRKTAWIRALIMTNY